MVRLIERSHDVGDGVVTYPVCRPIVCDFLPARNRHPTTAREPPFRSGASTWSPTPAPTSTPPFTALRMASIWRVSTWRSSQMWQGSSSTPGKGASVGPELFEVCRSPTAPCSYGPVGPPLGTPAYAEGHPYLTRAAAATVRSVPAWSGLIPSTSTTSTMAHAPSTHSPGAGILIVDTSASWRIPRLQLPLPRRPGQIPRRRHLPGPCLRVRMALPAPGSRRNCTTQREHRDIRVVRRSVDSCGRPIRSTAPQSWAG